MAKSSRALKLTTPEQDSAPAPRTEDVWTLLNRTGMALGALMTTATGDKLMPPWSETNAIEVKSHLIRLRAKLGIVMAEADRVAKAVDNAIVAPPGQRRRDALARAAGHWKNVMA